MLGQQAEVKKLSATLPGGTLRVVQTPESVADVARLAVHFGETFYGTGLPATLMRIIQKALRPQREACSDAQRMELWRKQGGK